MYEVFINGIKIGYKDEGKGKTVLLLHGWGANKESLDLIFSSLKPSFRVVSLDLPGFGQSGEPDKVWNSKDYSDFLKEFLEETGIEPFCALGHSNGGRILIKASSDWFNPEKLILVDSAGLKLHHGPVYYIKVYLYKLGKKILKLPLLNKTKLYEKLIEKAGSSDYRNSSALMKGTMSALLAEDMTRLLPKIKAETLLIWGEKDTATPLWQGRKMEKLIKGSGLVLIKDGGHFSFIDNPGKVLSAIGYFLNH